MEAIIVVELFNVGVEPERNSMIFEQAWIKSCERIDIAEKRP